MRCLSRVLAVLAVALTLASVAPQEAPALTPALKAVVLSGKPGWVPQQADLFWCDFQNNRCWVKGVGVGPVGMFITDSRASTAMVQNTGGSWSQVAAQAIPLGTAGLQPYEARTNSLPNSSMAGASTTPSTLPTGWSSTGTGGVQTVVGLGTENGLPYIDIAYSGTPSGTNFTNFVGNNVIAATNGQTWTSSVFSRLIAGTLANVTALQLTAVDVGNAATTTVDLSPTAIMTRVRAVRAIGASATFAQTYIRWTASGAVNFTLRVYASPQLELGAFATPPIPTTNAAVTRADSSPRAQSPLSDAMTNLMKSFYFQGSGGASAFAGPARLLYFNTGQAYLGIATSTTVSINNGSNGVSATIGGSGTIGGALKVAASFDAAGMTVVANGGTKAVDAVHGWAGTTGLVTIGNINAGSRAYNGPIQFIGGSTIRGAFDGMTQ